MAGLALAPCHLVVLTTLTVAALAQVLRHVVSTEVSYEAGFCWGGREEDKKEEGRIIERVDGLEG